MITPAIKTLKALKAYSPYKSKEVFGMGASAIFPIKPTDGLYHQVHESRNVNDLVCKIFLSLLLLTVRQRGQGRIVVGYIVYIKMYICVCICGDRVTPEILLLVLV